MHGPRRVGWRGAAIGAALVVAFVSAGAQDSRAKNPYTGDPSAIAEGRALYLKTGCQACHGPNGEGATGPDLTDDVWVYLPTDATLFNAITNGRRGTLMPPWGGQLTPDEIWKIIAWIRSVYRGDPAKIIW